MLQNRRLPEDLKSMSPAEMQALAAEIRSELIETVSRNGGHLASNLGAVELSIALHRVFDSPRDKLVFDVGHQSYVHKLLTGRAGSFSTLRQKGGVNGFPNPNESEHDAFTAGHASTAISAALGLARARDLRGEDHAVVAVVGDGALTGGMCYEALNDAGVSGTRLIVVLNDNEMSISRNVGAVSAHLTTLRQSSSYLHAKSAIRSALERLPVLGSPIMRGIERIRDAIKALVVGDQFFEALGFNYTGPIDGHNIDRLVKALTVASRLRRPVLLHVVTQKGKGYAPAENRPDSFHGVAPNYIEAHSDAGRVELPSGTTAAGALCALAKADERICLVVAAMLDGTGMKAFATGWPERYFDVGIAEEHAVEMAAGLAAGGMRPFVAIYSTFLQRAYDQILTDVCLPALPVTFLLDRSGFVGEDGATHQGLYDLSWLRSMPGMTICAPSSLAQLRTMIALSMRRSGPFAIRYSKSLPESLDGECDLCDGRSACMRDGDDVCLFAVGDCVSPALAAAELLAKDSVSAAVWDARFVKPLDEETLCDCAKRYTLLATVEENVAAGGFGSAVVDLFAERGLNVRLIRFAVPDTFVPHATIVEQRASMGLDAASIAERIRSELHKVTDL